MWPTTIPSCLPTHIFRGGSVGGHNFDRRRALLYIWFDILPRIPITTAVEWSSRFAERDLASFLCCAAFSILELRCIDCS